MRALFLGSYLSFTALYSFVLIANISPNECMNTVRHRASILFRFRPHCHCSTTTSCSHFVVCLHLMYACVLCLRVHLCSTCVCLCQLYVCHRILEHKRLLSSSFFFDANLYKYHLFPLYYHYYYFSVPTTENIQRDSFSHF